MATVADAPAQALVTDDDLAQAEQQYEDGVEAFDEDDFDTASDLLAQAVEVKVAKFGEHNVKVVPAYVKYAAALLGCARNQDDNVLGALKTATKKEDQTATKKADQASTSTGITKPEAPPDASVPTEGEDDLNLAWEMAEVARITLYQTAETDETAVSCEDFAEVHEILADISSEREGFDESITDYQQALSHLSKAAEKDERWQAELNFKISLPLQFLNRVGEATDHITAALAQMKSCVKQKKCRKEELEAEAKASDSAPATATPAPADTAGADAASTAAATAAPGAAAEAAADADAAPAEGEATAEEEESALAVVERELTQLAGVLRDLEERKAELLAVAEQDKVVKEQLKAMMGGLSGTPDAAAAGTSAKAGEPGAPAAASVQDLGVRGKAKADEGTKDDAENGSCNVEPASKRAKTE